MIIKYNTALINRKAKFLEESVAKLSEIRTRMVNSIEELKDSYDGAPDSATFNQKSNEYINTLQKIEDSLVQYIEVLTNASVNHDRIVTEYSDRQRRLRDGFQVQK